VLGCQDSIAMDKAGGVIPLLEKLGGAVTVSQVSNESVQ